MRVFEATCRTFHTRAGRLKSNNITKILVDWETWQLGLIQGVSSFQESTIRQGCPSSPTTTFDASNFNQNTAAACWAGQCRASPRSSRRRAASSPGWWSEQSVTFLASGRTARCQHSRFHPQATGRPEKKTIYKEVSRKLQISVK